MNLMHCILCEHAQPELIDARGLARRWNVPVSWIREHTRKSCTDPIPHLRMGKYVRFEWGSQELAAWHARCRNHDVTTLGRTVGRNLNQSNQPPGSPGCSQGAEVEVFGYGNPEEEVQ